MLLCASKDFLLHLVTSLVEKSSGKTVPLHNAGLQESIRCSAVGMNNTWFPSALTSFPPMASNIFSSCTLSCWMLFIRMQGWREKSRCLLVLRMTKYFHQWYSLCLNTFPSTTRPEIQPGDRLCTDFSTQIWKRKVTFSPAREREMVWLVPETPDQKICGTVIYSSALSQTEWADKKAESGQGPTLCSFRHALHMSPSAS